MKIKVCKTFATVYMYQIVGLILVNPLIHVPTIKADACQVDLISLLENQRQSSHYSPRFTISAEGVYKRMDGLTPNSWELQQILSLKWSSLYWQMLCVSFTVFAGIKNVFTGLFWMIAISSLDRGLRHDDDQCHCGPFWTNPQIITFLLK